jgi:adhesin/invasin
MKTKPVIISVLAILFIIVCGINTTYAGPTAAITLSATPLSVPADGVSSIAITAILVDSPGKNPVDIGTTATFTTMTGPGNFRNLTNTITETVAAINQKSDGAYIVVSLMSELNISGTTQISCTSNGVTQYITVSFDAIGSLSLTALPTWIPADGKSTSTLTATVKNTAGLPVAVGTDVRFITTLGLLSSGLESPATDITVQVSNGTGVVSVSLIAGIVPGIAEVTCISNGMTQTVTVAMGVGSITLTASPTSLPADGHGSSEIKAVLKNSAGVAVSVGTSVTFTLIFPVISPEVPPKTPPTFSNGTNTITLGTIDATGIVTTSLIAGTASGLAEVVCSSGGLTQSASISIGSLPIASITLAANPGSIPADGYSSSTITATVLDVSGNPLNKDSVAVTFTTNLGHFSNGFKTITVSTIKVSGLEAGKVVVSLIAETTSGVALVICESGSVTQSINVTIGSSADVASITLAANPTSLPADGASSSTLTATLLDISGNPLNKDNVLVKFTTTLGHFSNGTNTITVATMWVDPTWFSIKPGMVLVSLIAGTTPGIALITCESGNVTQATNVTIGTSGQVASITLSASPSSLPADGASSSTLTAQLLDTSGNLINLSSIPVTFTTTLGHFSNNLQTITVTSQSTTAVPGKVVVSLIAGTTSGIALIKCESGGVTQTTNVTIGTSGQVASITLSASPSSLPADGASSSTLTAQLLDTSGNLINLSSIPVTFTTTLGHFSNNLQTITVTSQSTTAVPGKVVVSLIAGTTSGIALIKCESGGVTQTTNVTIGSSAQVATITLSASPTTLPADGISSLTITALLKDITGNPITQSNISVTFTTTQGLGHFSNGSNTITVTTANSVGSSGAVVVSLIAGTTSGTAVITCASGGVTQATTIIIGSATTVASTITLTASPSSFPASDATLSSTITATLYTANGQPVSSGVLVSFATNRGFFSNNQQTVIGYTNSSGVALAYVYSGGIVGTAQINASAGAGISRFVFVNFTGPSSTADIVLSLDCTGSCDGKSFFTITATLYDRYGQFVSSGEAVNFTTTIGYFANKLSTITAYTNASGVASVVIYSGGLIGTAQVSASSNGIIRYMDVKFTGVGQPADIVLSFDCLPNCDTSSFFTITATLYDKNRQPVSSGVEVDFTTTLGYFSNKLRTITVYTDSTGVASVVFYSGDEFGTAQISASSYGITRYIDVICAGGWPPADIVLSLTCPIACDTSTYFTITATVRDKKGNTISSGVKVDFTTTLGYFSNKLKVISAYTNSVGVASIVFYSGGVIGTAQISASSYGITRYLDVLCTGVGTPTYISLSAARGWIPADGYSYTAVTAVILDGGAKPVPAGTAVEFSTTLGTFENGKQKYLVATPGATGIVTVHLIATGTSAGFAYITCTWGSGMAAAQPITVQTVLLEYETEPNNDMAQADKICFSSVFLGQLSSPYEEDWYTFTITESSRIGINFITTAIPKIAGDCKDSTTVGTYRIDIRDGDNNILMSYQNVDCSLDNGIWETGVIPAGKYYVVVFCPRLADNSHYLSTPYYLAVYNNLYYPCGASDKLVNSAALAQKSSAYQLHLPIIDPVPYLWADFQYDPIPSTSLMFKLTNYGVLTNLDGYRACNLSTLSLTDGNYVLHIPLLIFNDVSYRADLIYMPTTDGQIWFMLSGFWAN